MQKYFLPWHPGAALQHHRPWSRHSSVCKLFNAFAVLQFAQVGINNQVCCQFGIQTIAGICTQTYRPSYLQANVVPGIGMPSLTGMTQASAHAQAGATGRSQRRAYTRPAGLTTTTLRHSSPACHCQVILHTMIGTSVCKHNLNFNDDGCHCSGVYAVQLVMR